MRAWPNSRREAGGRVWQRFGPSWTGPRVDPDAMLASRSVNASISHVRHARRCRLQLVMPRRRITTRWDRSRVHAAAVGMGGEAGASDAAGHRRHLPTADDRVGARPHPELDGTA